MIPHTEMLALAAHGATVKWNPCGKTEVLSFTRDNPPRVIATPTPDCPCKRCHDPAYAAQRGPHVVHTVSLAYEYPCVAVTQP